MQCQRPGRTSFELSDELGGWCVDLQGSGSTESAVGMHDADSIHQLRWACHPPNPPACGRVRNHQKENGPILSLHSISKKRSGGRGAACPFPPWGLRPVYLPVRLNILEAVPRVRVRSRMPSIWAILTCAEWPAKT